MDRVYFANEEPDKIAGVLYDKVTKFYEEIQQNGHLELWRKVHRYYFAMDTNGRHEASAIQSGGVQGELSLLKANHYRNLIQHLHVLITQQKPAFECKAVNMDHKSQIQTILGRNILEYYLREKRLGAQYRQCAEYALTYSEGYVEEEWDAGLGDEVAVDVETGEMIYTGDVVARVYEPINVIRPCKSDKDKQTWYILRRWESRHDLMARYPDQADDISNLATDDVSLQFDYYTSPYQRDDDDDRIAVYTLYHDRTPACRSGRKVIFVSNDLTLSYEDLDTPDLPVYPMIPFRQHGTSFGYSVSFDLLCVQEAIDLLYSTILSNQSTFGVQNIWMKPGSNLSESQLGGGLNIFESSEKPEPINLTNTPPEIFNFLKGLEQLGQVLSGVNSVARGQPEASLKSGAALALIASQAVQFSNGLQAAYTQLLEDTGTGLLRILQTRAALPRATVIAGKDNKSYIKEFTSDDLRALNRVIVDVGNPVASTIAGRIQMAQDMLQAQVIKRPEEYIQVIETGRIDPILDDQRAEQLLIDAENEYIKEGKQVIVTAVDQHVEHIKGHKAIFADPDVRLDPVIMQAALGHIQEHIQALQQTDPNLLNVLGMAPIAPQQNGAPQPPQGANAPQPNAQPQPGEQMAPPPNTPPEVAANMPKMPQVPQQ